MDSSTKAELIDAGGSALMSVAKEMFVRQREQDLMRERAQMDKEIAQARAGGGDDVTTSMLEAPQGRDGVVQTLGKAEELAEEYNQLLEDAEQMESCELCKRLIRGARERPVDEQKDLLPALRDFFRSVEDDTPTEEVARRMRQHDTLMQLVRQEVAQ